MLPQILDDRAGVALVHWRSEYVDHLLNTLLPCRAVHNRRDHGDVIEAVTDRAPRHRHVAPDALLQCNALLACARRTRREGANRECERQHAVPHTTTSCSV